MKFRQIITLVLFLFSAYNLIGQHSSEVGDSTTYYLELYKRLHEDYTFTYWEDNDEIFRCIHFFERNQDSIRLAQAWISLSKYEGSRGKYNSSFDALWKALAIADAINDIFLRHSAHLHLARLYSVFDKHDEAYHHQQIVLELAKEGVKKGILPENVIVSAYYDFVHYFRITERYRLAEKHLDTCYQLANQFNFTYDDRAYLLSEKGHLLLHQGKVPEAISILEESVRNFSRINPSYLTIIYFYLASAYEANGQLLAAKKHYQSTVENVDKNNLHFDTKAEALLRISKILNQMGNHEEAYATLTESKELFDNMFSAKSNQNESLLAIRNSYQEQMLQKNMLIRQRDQAIIEHKTKIRSFQLILIVAFAIITIALLFWYLKNQSRKYESEKKTQQMRYKLQEAKNNALVELKNKELTSFTLRLIDKDSLINDLTDSIKKYAPQNVDLLKTVKFKTTGRLNLWEEFDKRFIDVNKGFYENLKSKFPNLTPTELKHCALIKLNFSAKEMAQLLNISLYGVNTSRYRIRKKLGLAREDNLTGIISSL